MRVLVLGSTGNTGLCLVEQALERGWSVKAIVRSPQKLDALKNDNLEVVPAELTSMSAEELSHEIVGCDAVLSALGSRSLGYGSPVTIYSDTIKTIVHAMKKASVLRLICVTSWYTKPDSQCPFLFRWIIRPLLLGSILDDMARMENYLEDNAGEINYTIVRPPQLLDQPVDNLPILKEEALSVSNVAGGMSRANVARFMLDVVNLPETFKKMYAVAVSKKFAQ